MKPNNKHAFCHRKEPVKTGKPTGKFYTNSIRTFAAKTTTTYHSPFAASAPLRLNIDHASCLNINTYWSTLLKSFLL